MVGEGEGSEFTEPAAAPRDEDVCHGRTVGASRFLGVDRATTDETRWTEAGLLDPSSPAADGRRALLRWLTELGIGIESMVEANRIGDLTGLPGDRALQPGARFTVAELARRTGFDLDTAVQLRIAAGFAPSPPDESSCTADDVTVFELFSLARSLFSHDELLHFTRVVGTSVRRVAEAANEMFMRDVGVGLQRDEVDELGQAMAGVQAVELACQATGLFDPLFRAHLGQSNQAARRAHSGHHDLTTTPLTVGFVDLAGFTERVGAATPAELLQLVSSFEATAHDLVTSHGGRLVKLIGDEVMFATVEPDDACTIALALMTLEAVPARGGLAHGEVVTSGGDLYGTVVNLASRIADQAIVGEVLVNEAIVSTVAGRTFEPAGRRSLKGFSEPVRLWSLTR
jgi:adenylate cyclase